VDYTLSDCVFWLISSTVRLHWVLLPLKARDVLELICLFFEIGIYLLLILDDSLGHNLAMLDHWSITRTSGRRLRLVSPPVFCGCSSFSSRTFNVLEALTLLGSNNLIVERKVSFKLCLVISDQLTLEVNGVVGFRKFFCEFPYLSFQKLYLSSLWVVVPNWLVGNITSLTRILHRAKILFNLGITRVQTCNHQAETVST